MSKFVEIPRKIDTNTASAEESTLKTPLSAQNQGVSVVSLDLTKRIPTGKQTPSMTPRGITTRTDVIILIDIDEDDRSDHTVGRRKRVVIIPETMTRGYMNTNGALVRGMCSLARLPKPALKIRAKRRIPSA
jgi:hypothetical protein